MSVSRRRTLGLFATALAGSSSVTDSVQAAEDGGWAGVHVSGGCKGYADTPMGHRSTTGSWETEFR
jgi:hypothetical protein